MNNGMKSIHVCVYVCVCVCGWVRVCRWKPIQCPDCALGVSVYGWDPHKQGYALEPVCGLLQDEVFGESASLAHNNQTDLSPRTHTQTYSCVVMAHWDFPLSLSAHCGLVALDAVILSVVQSARSWECWVND